MMNAVATHPNRGSVPVEGATALRESLATSLRAYFSLAQAETLPERLTRLVERFESALRTKGETATPDFRDGLMRAMPALRTFALSLTGNATRADDLLQETLVKAWANHHRFQPGTQLVAWLFTIMRNQFYSEMRKAKREVEDADGSHAGRLTSTPDQEDVCALKGLYAKLEMLPTAQREALLLVGAEGYTYEEVADLVGCRVGTVKSRVSRARAQLAGLMGFDDAAAAAEAM
ncbi:sigma-70 family RNA polymerase sigma factor [Methylobacterium nigriterrae]|uniref:sigma-70 family RNA polymerase sigma factor n=1 Tax=Methylobacterium nigriterrae TaxID=3127512 RepID=UPI0030136326